MHQQLQKTAWAKRLVFLWCGFAVLSVGIIWTGCGKVFVYTWQDGTQITSETFEGQTVMTGEKNELRFEFDHTKWAFRNQPLLRILIITFFLVVLIFLTLFRLNWYSTS